MIPPTNGSNGSKDEDRATLRQATRNLNTILLWATMAGMGAVAWMTWTTSISVAELKGSLVTRPELEAKIAEVKAVQMKNEADLTALKLALAERGITGHQR